MKKKSRIISFILCIALLLSLNTASVFGASAKWPSTTNIKTYVISTGNNTTVYQTATSTKKYGTIYASDLITIKGYSGARLKVTYPIKGGTKTGYIDKSKVTGGSINYASDKWTQNKKATAYRRSSGGATIGSLYVGDVVYKIAAKGSYTQVIYPISGGYKMGWIKNSDISKKNVSSGTASSASKNVSSKISAMMSGSSYSGAYKLNKKYTGEYASEQCKGFAKSVHKKLFGYNIGSTKAKPNNYQISYSGSNTKVIGSLKTLSASSVKSMFSKARPGDFVQMRRSHGGSHSAIIASVTSSNVTFYEANLDGRNTIVKKTYTWSQLCSSNKSMSVYSAKKY